MDKHDDTGLLPWILSAAIMLIMGIAVATYSDESDAASSRSSRAKTSSQENDSAYVPAQNASLRTSRSPG